MRAVDTIRVATIAVCAFSVLITHGASIAFSVPEVAVDESYLPSGPVAIRNAYLKYGVELPQFLVARDGTVTATPTQYDTIYNVPVAVGSPAVTYTMSIDTGSSDFSLYAPKLGTSGSVTTTVNIGGVVVTKQIVNLNSDSTGGSNIVGLSYSGKTFYTNAVSQGAIAAVFTANLKKGAPGTYTFGFINTASYTGSITYVSVITTNGFWEFNSNGYAIGSGSFVTLTIDGIVDTGTTLLFLPQSVVKTYYSQVSGAVLDNTQGGYTFPCAATLPNLVIGIGSYKAIVPGMS
jgi:hypoxanthine-guanine phosphoribosyltransferase